MVGAKTVSRDAAREVLTLLVAEGGGAAALVAREGLGALGADDGDGLAEAVDRAIAGDPDAAAKVGAGNTKAIGPLVGAVMREIKGRADGGEVTRLIRENCSPRPVWTRLTRGADTAVSADTSCVIAARQPRPVTRDATTNLRIRTLG